MEFFVGTFNKNYLYTLSFTPPSTLRLVQTTQAVGPHSWLALSPDKRTLYATSWLDRPAIAAYRVPASTSSPLQLLNTASVASRSGYVAATSTHLYSAGGPSGEVFALAPDGALGPLVQTLSFLDPETSDDAPSENRLHGDFGGLRHGAHSADLSPDGRALYVADIGRNCVWTFSLASAADADAGGAHATLKQKAAAPREGDGPRHATPHPGGRVLYAVQEHSSVVDAYAVGDDGTSLTHVGGASILPDGKRAEDFWADEVRVSSGPAPRFLYASTRGLEKETRGYVAVFELGEGGEVRGVVEVWETPTSGGFANAVEPAPRRGGEGGVEYLALTDSEEGWVFVLAFDGKKVREAARLKLVDEVDGGVVGAATAVWL